MGQPRASKFFYVVWGHHPSSTAMYHAHFSESICKGWVADEAANHPDVKFWVERYQRSATVPKESASAAKLAAIRKILG